ncbi:unnamed protein product, partial [Laminaria digitata]
MCSYDVTLHALGGAIKTPSTPAVALAAHVSANTKAGKYTSKEFPKLCVKSGIAMDYAATVTPQQKRFSVGDGQTLATKTRCMLRGGNN